MALNKGKILISDQYAKAFTKYFNISLNSTKIQTSNKIFEDLKFQKNSKIPIGKSKFINMNMKYKLTGVLRYNRRLSSHL